MKKRYWNIKNIFPSKDLSNFFPVFIYYVIFTFQKKLFLLIITVHEKIYKKKTFNEQANSNETFN